MAMISVQDVGVNFQLNGLGMKRFLPTPPSSSRNGGAQPWALRDISIHLEDGDRLGLLGDNGAGKTTLLKVMAGILPPTAGTVRSIGRVSALMAIHIGMFPNLSGTQNIATRCRFMGFTEKEIAAQAASIAEFTELGEYLDYPLRTYSAGMRLRLAFSVATAFKPEILIMDEWLSAGDAKFKRKARARLENLIADSGVFAFASHSEQLQKQICNKGVVLRKGQVIFSGEIDAAWDFVKEE